MNTKQRKTLSAIFANPINGNIEWRRIEFLLVAIGCELIEGSGSRVTFILNDQRVDLHRPHPRKEALRYRVKDVREFLKRAGITP
ncbi:MAG: type II toxin-antitoxin system HicA family toxin [Chloroflexi bacterium]|nr:type II toxin-antitoxin system HicA family toxin [Chloroflexota bacterium]